MESILTSIKKLLGIPEDYTQFDPDVIIHINSVLMILNQLGVGPSEGFSIQDSSAVWTDLVPDTRRIESIKSYVYLKVKLLFDPPQNSAVTSSYEKLIAELESRINIAAESTD